MPIQDDVYAWLQGLEPWQQELYLLCANASELDTDALDSVLALLIDDSSAAQRIERSDLPRDLEAGASVDVASIEHVRGVNRLAAGERLGFVPHGVNVVYGFNGAGKSGWARIPKHAGRARRTERVLGDVFVSEQERPQPTARITWRLAGQPRELELRLDQAAPGDLASMCVFDSQSAASLVGDELELDYVPLALASVKRLHRGHVEVADRLQQRIAAVTDEPLSLDGFRPGTSVHDALGRLTATTDLDALRGLMETTDPARRAELTRQVAAIDADNTEALAVAAERDARLGIGLAAALLDVATRLDKTAMGAASEELTALATAQAVVDRTGAAEFATEPMAGAATEPWLLLWNAADSFFRSAAAGEWPQDASHCPVCMQELSADAEARLQRFHAFVRSDVEQRLRVARDAVAARTRALPNLSAVRSTHAAAIESLAATDASLARTVDRWLDDADTVLEALRAQQPSAGMPPPPDLRAWSDARLSAATQHRRLQDPVTTAAVRRELDELRDREALSARWAEIEQRVERARELVRWRDVEPRIRPATVANRLRTFSERFVTADLQAALDTQMRQLNFDAVEIVRCTTSGRGGTPRVGLKIRAKTNVPLRAVLSEGEQRRLALAFFLAEVSVAYAGQPIVLDDPVTSVDHQGRRHIARTLARATARHQVIVFTHELAFLHELQRATTADQVPLHIQYVHRRDGQAGRVSDDLPWDGKTASKRIRTLRDRLQTLTAQHRRDPDDPQYAEDAARFCTLLRQAFERALEDDVLGGVVTRADVGIHPQQLRSVAWSDEICRLTDLGMAENSPWVHDRARTINAPPPTPAELTEGLAVLDDLCAEVKAVLDARKRLSPAPPPQSAAPVVAQLPGMPGAA